MAHNHSVYDTDIHFSIDPITRAISSRGHKKITLIQGDHNSERFTFEIPRNIEGHDMSLCNLVEVHYLNIDATTKEQRRDKYTVTDLQIAPEDSNVVLCSWLVSGSATQLVGPLNFLLKYKCIEGTVITYAWNSAVFSGISISTGIDAGETFQQDFADVIEQWKAEAVKEITGDVNAGVAEWQETESGRLRAIIAENNSEVNAALAVERARIDSFVKLPDGSTTGDAELQDIRVGADGVKYPNAGTAVREQTSSMNREIQGHYAKTPNRINRHTLVKGYLNENTGALLSSDAGADSFFDRFVTTDYIAVNGGETYTIYNSIASAYSRVLYYTDKNAIHSVYTTGAAVNEYTVTIPEGVSCVRCSFENLAPGNAELYSVEKPAFNSMVVTGEDVHSPMYGTLDPVVIDGGIRWNENSQIKPETICGFKRLTNNLFNKYDAVDNKFLSQYLKWLDGETFCDYFTSGYIPVEPGQTYTLSPVWSVSYFTKQFVLIDSSAEVGNTTLTVTIPDNGHYIRFRALMANKDVVMVNRGDVLLPYEDYQAVLEFMPPDKPTRLHTLKEALCCWCTGEKFPIGFFGDSTTDGMGTTSGGGHETQDSNAGGWGHADYINTAAYPYKLERLLKVATGNDTLRVYNIGYSGHRFKSVLSHYDDIFGHAYADVKMVGIVFGINDRLTKDAKAYYAEFRENLTYTVEYLYKKGIQPFMVTTQSIIEPFCPTTIEAQYYPLRDSENVNTIANGIMREIASEYGLEVIDMNAYGEFMMNYSLIPMNDICTDNLHFKDAGHTAESEYLYSVLCGRCAYVRRGDVLTFASQKVKSKCPADCVENFATAKYGFKVYAEYARSDTADIVLQDFVVYVDEKEPVTLSAYCIAANTQYVVVDDTTYTINSATQDVCTLDVGVHRIKAMSGSSASVNWIGFKIK